MNHNDSNRKETTKPAIREYERCYKQTFPICRRTCRMSCLTQTFITKVTHTKWPPNDMISQADNPKTKSHLEWLRLTHSKVSLKYQRQADEVHIMYPTLTFAQLIANIGGIVSALIGVSVVSMYRFLTRQVFKCNPYPLLTT